jgi:hypothetical protein
MVRSSFNIYYGFFCEIFLSADIYNSSHLEWRAGLSDTILKGTHPARFGLIWFSGFRGEDLNVIFALV